MSTKSHVTVEPSLASEWQRRCRLAIRILAGFEFVLILATWPLWWGGGAFPAIPLLSSAALPRIVERLLVATLLSACAITVGGIGTPRWNRLLIYSGIVSGKARAGGFSECFSNDHRRLAPCRSLNQHAGNLAARITALAAAVVLVLSDQHRLQAWHWLFMLGFGASFFRPAHGLQLLRAMLASVYVCSALSRISAIAHQGMSAAIVDQLLRMMSIDARAVGAGKLEILCHGFNAAELIVGLLLIYPKTRRYGILSAVALHGTLLIALGPFGLRHHSAVLLWNLCFVCLIPVIFTGPVLVAVSESAAERWAYQASNLFVWLFPLSGLMGVADNWPSWQLYSTRPETWTLRINDADRNDLPKSLQPHVSEAAPLEHWVIVRLDRWSLAETESPIYPEDRFQCDVIRHVINKLPDNAEFQIEISEPLPWIWWRRRQRTIESRGDLDAERERFAFH